MSDKIESIQKNSKICGHCKWIKSINGSWHCDNPASRRYRDGVSYTYSPCDYYEHLKWGRSKGVDNDVTGDNEITVADVTVVPNDKPVDQVRQTVSEDDEQILKNVTVGRIEIDREDDKNVIHALINAISVHINMPRGTVKALMALVAVILIATLIHTANSGNEGTKTFGMKEYPGREISKESSEAVAAARDVAISENYSYTLPAGSVREEAYVGGAFANARAYCFLNESEDYCVVRSYITDKRSDDLREEIASMTEPVVDIVNVQYENESFDFGDVLICSYETVSSDDKKIRVMMYSWYDDSAICFLEVSSAYDSLEGTAQSLIATVHKSHNSISNADLLKAANSVQISSHYFYKMPEGTMEVYDPEEVLAEGEQFLDFKQDGDIYTVRSYVLEFSNGELSEIVKASLSQFDGVSFVDEETIEGKYTDVHVIRFEVDNGDGTSDKVTGFYWSEIDPKICCLEVIADEWGDGKAEQMIMDSVYRKTDSSGETGAVSGQQSGLSPSDMQKAYDDARMEEYQNQIVEDYYNDQINDYYNNEPHGLPY